MTKHSQGFEIGRLGQATCSVWSSARLIKVQGNPTQAGFLFHRVATKQACMKSSHNPRPGKRCSGRKPNWPYISLVHTYTCLTRAIHIDPSNTLRPCSLSLFHPYVYLAISWGIFYHAHTLSLDLPPMWSHHDLVLGVLLSRFQTSTHNNERVTHPICVFEVVAKGRSSPL